MKAAGKRGMAQLSKGSGYAVLHAAVTRENGFPLKRRKMWKLG